MDYDVNETGPGQNTRLQHWVDSAMYAAEPIDAEEGPRVTLVEATPDPLGSIAAASLLYEGVVIDAKQDVTDAQRRHYLAEMQKTKIKAPLEFVQFHFLIEGVTRGFTHQMVRQRTATFVQESTRFAVKEDVPVALPPSLAGTQVNVPERDRTENDRLRVVWEDTVSGIRSSYNMLIDMGMPAEDARGLLPTNLLTRIHYSTDLRALLDHAGNRLCTQAQFEWRLVFAQMAHAIRQYRPKIRLKNAGGWTSGWAYDNTQDWQWEAIAALLQPVCYQIGKCAFEASFDRKCSIRDRVQQFAARNIPSAHWRAGAPGVTVEGVSHREPIRGIDPREWLLDPGAAR